jgi:hypothetical protein
MQREAFGQAGIDIYVAQHKQHCDVTERRLVPCSVPPHVDKLSSNWNRQVISQVNPVILDLLRQRRQ